jgi:RimJ/RimL family protein N-acetyltransferase
MTNYAGNNLLLGQKVRLRRLQRTDVPNLLTMYSDLDILSSLSMNSMSPPTPQGLERWLFPDHENHHDLPMFAICHRESGQFLGVCAFKNWRMASRHSLFFIALMPDQRGQGYGTDAVEVLVRFGFWELNLNCIALEVMAFNQQGIAAYKKVGFEVDAKLREFMYRDGQYHELWMMSLTRAMWQARHERTD